MTGAQPAEALISMSRDAARAAANAVGSLPVFQPAPTQDLSGASYVSAGAYSQRGALLHRAKPACCMRRRGRCAPLPPPLQPLTPGTPLPPTLAGALAPDGDPHQCQQPQALGAR